MAGKQKCRILREIRQKIADENDIPFVTEECRYKGDCKGTCPKCESELRYLEQQLEKRRALGKKVTVSALALGMAASFTGCRPQLAGYMEKETTTVEQEILEGEVVPPDETTSASGEPQETGTRIIEAFDPSENVNEDVYGPPMPDEQVVMD